MKKGGSTRLSRTEINFKLLKVFFLIPLNCKVYFGFESRRGHFYCSTLNLRSHQDDFKYLFGIQKITNYIFK